MTMATRMLPEPSLFILLVLFIIQPFSRHQANNKNKKYHYTKRDQYVDDRAHKIPCQYGCIARVLCCLTTLKRFTLNENVNAAVTY